ncbi:MAG: hypothetical protein AB8H80_23505 [Planctomycetota bacterium]
MTAKTWMCSWARVLVFSSLLSGMDGAPAHDNDGRAGGGQDPNPAAPAGMAMLGRGGRVPIGDGQGLLRRVDSIERHGITWTFAQPVVTGGYANGDPWVKGPVEIVSIEPKTVAVEGRAMHGSMIDPEPHTDVQGYDGMLYGKSTGERYDPKRNVALGVDKQSPLVLQVGQSLVSVESRKQTEPAPSLVRAAVLTCVDELPAPDSFRPPYVAVRGGKGSKSHVASHREIQLDYGMLRRLQPVDEMPNIRSVAPRFERLWLDHIPQWIRRHLHPKEHMPDYGRDIGALVGTAGLLLNTDASDADKRDLLVRFVQFGLDSHAVVKQGGKFKGVGGHGHGRKLPILVAGLVLHDDELLAVGRDFPSIALLAGGKGARFAEDGQTFFIRETSKNVYNWGHGGYQQEHVGLPEWGFSHADDPARDDVAWDSNPYRRCCTANAWLGQALTARVMGLQEQWSHEAWFAYVDRYQQAEHKEAWHRAWVSWHVRMWQRYREQN